MPERIITQENQSQKAQKYTDGVNNDTKMARVRKWRLETKD